MPSFEEYLSSRLQQDEEQNLTRCLSVLPEGIVTCSGNDYLGLSRHPRVVEAAANSLKQGQIGASAARLVSGNHPEHILLEKKMAAFKGTEACLAFPSGYAAACGAIPALMDRADYVVLDKLCHACLFDGARLSGATLAVFAHNDTSQLTDVLREIRSRQSDARILIVVESVYSMDGDIAPLEEICRLKQEFGAWLMVDEAHATGIYGPQGRGLCAERKIAGQVEIQMGTLGKALGVSGGYIAGNANLKQLLLQHARSFIFSTGTPPCLSAALLAALEIVGSGEGTALREKLWANVQRLYSLTGGKTNLLSPITPLILGDEEAALRASRQLLEAGFYIPAIRYPSVARGTARLRITLNSLHTPEQISGLAAALAKVCRAC
ncbi:MAG: 8-amino-7-oxononanoate synthase [Methylacidiphilales bacterium]|nr:8-amino-7-oxononanoate synthase [Candidatus Methylacidiphilales bacterium]